jgi:SnoaL-like domain
LSLEDFTEFTAADIAAAWACQQTVLRFTAHFDAGEFDQMKSYFCDDGVWIRPHETIVGHHGIDERIAANPDDRIMRHQISNMRTSPGSDGAVTVESYFAVYIGPHDGMLAQLTPAAVGRYTDQLRCEAGRWLIAERRVRFDLRQV